MDSAMMLLGAIHLCGLIAAWWTRLSHGLEWEATAQRVFLAYLSVAGASVCWAHSVSPVVCIFSGFSLGMMVLVGVWDFGPRRELDYAGGEQFDVA